MPDTTLVHPSILERWSPRAFTNQPIDPAALRSLFEAARWSASCFNEQPWRFIVATRAEPEEFARILKLLAPKNQEWAQSAWLLGLTAGKKTFSHNGAPDRFGLHDAGAALTTLFIQATWLGLRAHGMGGFDDAAARTEFGIPEDFEVGAAFAVGHPEGALNPPPGRSRRPLHEIVFAGGWEKPRFTPE
ncbi:MAG: nitroreductase family protein [Terriglobia bacterium]